MLLANFKKKETEDVGAQITRLFFREKQRTSGGNNFHNLALA